GNHAEPLTIDRQPDEPRVGAPATQHAHHVGGRDGEQRERHVGQPLGPDAGPLRGRHPRRVREPEPLMIHPDSLQRSKDPPRMTTLDLMTSPKPKTTQTMKPATAAKKLGILLSAAPAEFQEGVVSRDELNALQASPPEWLTDLRRNGPHPKQVVAA